MDADEAYAACERITWEQARNFAYGIRLLPPPKRRALAAVYAFARRIDDIGDGDLPAADKTARLEAARVQVQALAAGDSPDDSDPVLVALTDAGPRFGVPLAAFGELVDLAVEKWSQLLSGQCLSVELRPWESRGKMTVISHYSTSCAEN